MQVNEIPGVDADQRVSLYLVLSMLMISQDHLSSQYPVCCKLLRVNWKHD